MSRLRWYLLAALFAGMVVAAIATPSERRWLAGDSHIHSHWSPGYDRTKNPPEPIKGEDAMYPTPLNAQMARRFGLSWMVTTDHGGPNHSKLNLTHAHEELKQSRQLVPEVLQFYGMELNLPAMDHHTLIIPNMREESSILFEIESRFDANEAWPSDPARNTEAARLAALSYVRTLPRLPLMFANHPARSARGVGIYGLDRAERVPRQQRSRRRKCIAGWKAPPDTRPRGLQLMAHRNAQRPVSLPARVAHMETPGRIPSAASTR